MGSNPTLAAGITPGVRVRVVRCARHKNWGDDGLEGAYADVFVSNSGTHFARVCFADGVGNVVSCCIRTSECEIEEDPF